METLDTVSPDDHVPLMAYVPLPNTAGIHARSAAALIRTAARFRAITVLRLADRTANARSLTQLLQLGARQGDVLCIETSGPDARDALQAIQALIEQGFGEA
jgi:phosphotransferase system HPr (HPr) family protein